MSDSDTNITMIGKSAEPEDAVLRLDPRSRAELIECLELRLGIEVEAAGHAAGRATRSQIDRIAECLDDMQGRIDAGELGGSVDFAFHMAVADAASNRYMVKFLMALGLPAVPRARQGSGGGASAAALDRERELLAEHKAVHAAIAAGDAMAARAAMRTHLENALRRYRAQA
ncbi:FadR/GntR family transcriptional regulator [Oceanomicrobium pacificus]|uniref:FCD domain-containing protein n=1 Tax=Oceanomicrobium pacificus TaxID=2692916 RepID=A0A6B0TKW3_9RHOB|nr:FCD domain-containing protein [Oceanomicrobium pacificus]MXU65160.1 FCD domain-containing protein [Oceanomicrobium pacificus]